MTQRSRPQPLHGQTPAPLASLLLPPTEGSSPPPPHTPHPSERSSRVRNSFLHCLPTLVMPHTRGALQCPLLFPTNPESHFPKMPHIQRDCLQGSLAQILMTLVIIWVQWEEKTVCGSLLLFRTRILPRVPDFSFWMLFVVPSRKSSSLFTFLPEDLFDLLSYLSLLRLITQ